MVSKQSSKLHLFACIIKCLVNAEHFWYYISVMSLSWRLLLNFYTAEWQKWVKKSQETFGCWKKNPRRDAVYILNWNDTQKTPSKWRNTFSNGLWNDNETVPYFIYVEWMKNDVNACEAGKIHLCSVYCFSMIRKLWIPVKLCAFV